MNFLSQWLNSLEWNITVTYATLSPNGFVIFTLDLLSAERSAEDMVPLKESVGTVDLSSVFTHTPVLIFKAHAITD
jgi:hypothetical protein